ncbi:hypothetical protein ACIPD2_08805 [Streptomyces griseofuscus]|uniref:hypothetical protein n=1 Tax=Streptomyces griseofuscus TaxID=146922 RepID=UPI00380314DE
MAQSLDRAALALTEGRTAVLVMESGRVVEQGPSDELRASGGAYARLWASWAYGR